MKRKPASRLFIVPPLIASFALYGCFARPTGEYRTPYGAERYAPAPSEGFGYVSLGMIPYADFFGEIEGIDPGTGASATFPLCEGVAAAVAVTAIVVLLVAGAAAASDGGGDIDLSGLDFGSGSGDPDIWNSGVSDQSRYVISELSFDFTISGSRHVDSLHGGSLGYRSLLLGMRLGGPRRYVPRYYFTGGWGFHGFDYTNRPDAFAMGPYGGLGLEVFADPGLTFGIDYKAHAYLNAEDEEGERLRFVAGQVGLTLTTYW